jgi:hypothetical protein
MHPLEEAWMILRAVMIAYGVVLVCKFGWLVFIYLTREVQ